VYNGDSTAVNPNPSTLYGFMRCFSNEEQNIQCYHVDLDPNAVEVSTECDEVLGCCWRNTKNNIIVVREKGPFACRVAKLDKVPHRLLLPRTDRYEVVLPESKAISDLEIGPASKFELEEGFVEVAVRATG